MSPLWAYFWPPVTLGLVLGVGFGTAWFRRKRMFLVLPGMVLALAAAATWHGPLGAANRFTIAVEKASRESLVSWEMAQILGRLHRDPLSRRLLLSGPADDFQRSELVRILGTVPGVSRATWNRSGGTPLIVEAMLMAALAFVVGLVLAYVAELRRRYNAQWKW